MFLSMSSPKPNQKQRKFHHNIQDDFEYTKKEGKNSSNI